MNVDGKCTECGEVFVTDAANLGLDGACPDCGGSLALQGIDPILSAASSLPARAYPCCEYVARIVRAAYGLSAADHADGSAWWKHMNVWDVARPWSAPMAVYSIFVGESYRESRDARPLPEVGRWHVVQSWRSLSGPGGTVDPVKDAGMGHTWLWYATSPTHGVVLDSTVSRGPRLGGVAYTGQPLPAGRPWSGRVAGYHAGVAVAVLRPLT